MLWGSCRQTIFLSFQIQYYIYCGMEQRPKLLIFGGTVFIGKCFLDYLGFTKQSYEIYCLNRGTVYWDDAVRREHPEVTHINCDRKDPAQVKSELLKLNKWLDISSKNKWKAVLDFSAYFDTYLEPTPILSGLIQKYIIISTDSVYNNSLSRIKNPVPQNIFNVVEQLEKVDKQAVTDDYGYNKLKCQVFLNKNKPFPFICLRLPDVLGQYDQFQSSQRVWCTTQWVANSQKNPIYISQKIKTKKLSFVDSRDVARIVSQLINDPLPPHNEYNLSFNENPTILEFYQMIGQSLKKKVNWIESKKEVMHFFPSVQSGVIDCQRAKNELNWHPTPLRVTIDRIVDFYLKKAPQYPKQKSMMEKEYSAFISKFN